MTALLARCDDEDVRWLGASFRKLAELRRQSALPQPSCTERSIAQGKQLHLPLAPLHNSGYGFKNDSSTCEALRNLAAMCKHLRCLLRCLYGYQRHCAPRWAGGTSFMQRHRRQECVGLGAGPNLSVDHRLHGPASCRPETTNHRSKQQHRGGKCLTRQAPKPSIAFLSSVYHGDHLKNTAPFVPPLIRIGPEYYHLAVRTWRCKELHRLVASMPGERTFET